MCTLLSIDRAFFAANKDAVKARVRNDAMSNDDGASLLVLGPTQADSVLFRSMDAEKVLALMEQELTTGKGNRAWMHLRFATTKFVGLNGAHGFAAGDYTIFHNGCLSRKKALQFDVDSELIAWDIAHHGVQQAIKHVAEYDAFANVFAVNNKDGTWHAYRSKGGQLHTDGNSNYSTHPLAAIKNAVAPGTWDYYNKATVAQRPSYTSHYAWDLTWDKARDNWKKWLDRAVANDDEVEACLKAIDKEVHDEQTMDNFANDRKWHTNGVPKDVWWGMSFNQLDWARRCQLGPKYGS